MRWTQGSRRLTWVRWPLGVLLMTVLACQVSAQEVGCRKCGWFCGWFSSHFTPAIPPAPHGSFVRGFQKVQTEKAEAADFVFFLDEWFDGKERLGPYGKYHLTQVAQRLPSVPFPVLIQPDENPALNQARRELVVTALLTQGITDADARVVVAYPDVAGLPGDIAPLIYTRSLFPTSRYNLGGYGGYGGYGGLGGLSGISGYGGYGGYGGFGYGYGGYAGFGGYGISRPLIAGY